MNELQRRDLAQRIDASIGRGEGLLATDGRTRAFGHYYEKINGVLVGVSPNLLPTEGLNHMLDVWLGNVAKPAGWYIGLYANAINPAASWTAANVAATAGEVTSLTEGYTQTTRPQFTPNAAASGTKDNVGEEAQFTIATASQLNLEGAILISDSTRGGTAGKLGSASRFPATRVLQAGDAYEIGYRVTITS